MVEFREPDDRVAFARRLGESGGPIVLMNTFRVAPEDVDDFMEAWAADGEFMKKQPGYVSTQLHRGIAGSTTFINVAVWESIEALRAAAGKPEFQASLARYPDSSVASPHLFAKVAVPGICGGEMATVTLKDAEAVSRTSAAPEALPPARLGRTPPGWSCSPLA